MKIVILSSSYPPDVMGGGELSTRSLAIMLADMGHQVHSISFSDKHERCADGPVNIVRLVPAFLYNIYHANSAGFLKKILWRLREEYSPVLAKQLMNEIVSIEPDIVITSTIEDVSSFVWRLCFERGYRVAHILRSYYLLCWRGSMFKNDVTCSARCLECKMINVVKCHNTKYVTDVVGLTEAILEQHTTKGLFASSRKFVIYNDCNDAVTGQDRNAFPVTQSFGVKKLNIGYLGRIHPTKGIEDLILAVSKMNNSTNVKLLIAGVGVKSYVDQLSAFSNSFSLDSEFLGHQKQAVFFSKVDLLVVPSRWSEPFGRVIVEALLHNVPVFVRNVGGMPELVDSSCGAVFNNVEELAFMLDAYMSNAYNFTFSGADRYSRSSIMKSWEKFINLE